MIVEIYPSDMMAKFYSKKYNNSDKYIGVDSLEFIRGYVVSEFKVHSILMSDKYSFEYKEILRHCSLSNIKISIIYDQPRHNKSVDNRKK